MKQSKKLLCVLLAAVAVFSCCAVAAFAAAVQQPRIVLKASGVRNQYILRLEDFSSKFESVQFDIRIDRPVSAPEVVWRDNSASHFQRIDTSRKENETILTVYVDRLGPIANSNSVELAHLTFDQPVPASRFSAGGEMIALDENQEETVFQNVSLTVLGSAPGGGSSSGSSGGAGGGGGGSDSDDTSSGADKTLDWSDVSSRVSESDGRKTLTIRVREGQVIGHEIFRQAAQKGILLKLDYGDYIWTFHIEKGISIPTNRMYYDFSIQPIHHQNLSAAVDRSDIVQFEIAHSGQLPCEATLSYRVGSQYAGERVYLAYYDEARAALDYEQTAEVSSSGMADYSFTHASKYVISAKDVWGQSVPAAENTGTASPGGSLGTGNVIVAPEDEVEQPEELEEEEPEIEPDVSEPEEQTDAPVEEPGRSGVNWVLPLVILLLIAGAAGIVVVIVLRARENNRYD